VREMHWHRNYSDIVEGVPNPSDISIELTSNTVSYHHVPYIARNVLKYKY